MHLKKIWGHFPQFLEDLEGMLIPHATPPENRPTSTPPKFNIAPENRESQKETHLPTIHFQGLC